MSGSYGSAFAAVHASSPSIFLRSNAHSRRNMSMAPFLGEVLRIGVGIFENPFHLPACGQEPCVALCLPKTQSGGTSTYRLRFVTSADSVGRGVVFCSCRGFR